LVVGGAINAHQTNRGVFQYSVNNTAIRSYGATAGTGVIVFHTGGGGGSSDTERARIDGAGAISVNSAVSTTSSRPAVGTTRIAGEIAAGYTLGSDGGLLRLSAGGGTGAGTKSYIDLSCYSTDAAL
jgi:hypothetical protein